MEVPFVLRGDVCASLSYGRNTIYNYSAKVLAFSSVLFIAVVSLSPRSRPVQVRSAHPGRGLCLLPTMFPRLYHRPVPSSRQDKRTRVDGRLPAPRYSGPKSAILKHCTPLP